MSKWKMVKLGDVCKFINGDRGKNYPSGKDIVENGIPFINAGHLVNNEISFSSMNYITEDKYNQLGSGKIQKGDFLYCLRGSLGKHAIVENLEKGAVASSLVILRPTNIDVHYLSYCMDSPSISTQLQQANNGSSQPNLSANSVKQYIVPLPPLEEQKRIADILDKALLRAGRFDRQIHVDLPDVHERKQIFNVHLRPIKINETVDVNFLAKQTPGFSGADIANVCNEAALIAARKNKSFVEKQDFLDAVDRIVGGLEKKTKITTVAEKKSIAYHEAGHATISWMTEHANPLVKVTIVPRGEALGAAWYLPEERQLTNKDHILDEMCSTLGGRAAEEVFLKQISTGAINDLERVTKRAYAMVAYFGMSENMPNMSYYDSSGNSDYGFTKPYSEKTAELIDEEAKRIVAQEYERAKQILIENAAGHNALAELLIEREVIFSEDLEKIFGKRQWTSRQDELMAQNGGADILDETPKLGAASTAENQPAEEKTEEGQKEITTTEL